MTTTPVSTETPYSLWSTALDDFERRLNQFHSVLDRGVAPDGLWPPAEILNVPLPAELAERARTLITKAREIEGQIVARRDSLPTPRPAAQTRRVTPAFSTFSRNL